MAAGSGMGLTDYTISTDIELLSVCQTAEPVQHAFDAASMQPVAGPSFHFVPDTLRLTDVDGDGRTLDVLCGELDQPAIGSSLLNWKWLAQELGLDSRHITQVEQRATAGSGTSATRAVLAACPGLTVAQLVHVLTNMNRRDLLLCIAAPIKSCVDYLAAQPSASADTDQRMCSVVLTGAAAGQASDSQPFKYYRWLDSNLRKQPLCRVTRDDKLVAEARRAAPQHTSWITHADRVFDAADSIVVVLCDDYERLMNSSQDAPIDRLAVARHFYQRMQSEYLSNGCVNYRFRPVVFPHSSIATSVPVPSFLSTTVLFNWPAQQPQLFALIFDDPRLRRRRRRSSNESQASLASAATASASDSGLVNSTLSRNHQQQH